MSQQAAAVQVRRADARGRTQLDWLDSRHSFSFGRYHDPAHMSFRSLRVINDDTVAPGGGFGEHSHHDMEILTWVLDGGLQHRDSLGHGAVLHPGELQAMSAGTGIRHSEFNPSRDQPAHFLQIWIQPDRPGHAPRYAQRAFSTEQRRNRLAPLASPDSRAGSLPIHQDALLYAADLEPGVELTYELPPGRYGWLHVARGRLSLNDQPLADGDGAAITEPITLRLRGTGSAELLLFDLP